MQSSAIPWQGFNCHEHLLREFVWNASSGCLGALGSGLHLFHYIWSSCTPLCSPILDESTLQDVYKCGINMPSPDLLTPSKAAATIWSWAPGHPYPEEAPASWTSLWRKLSGAWTVLAGRESKVPLHLTAFMFSFPNSIVHTGFKLCLGLSLL